MPERVIRGHISLRMGFHEVALNFQNLNLLPQEVWWVSKRLEASLLFFGRFHSTASQGSQNFFKQGWLLRGLNYCGGLLRRVIGQGSTKIAVFDKQRRPITI